MRTINAREISEVGNRVRVEGTSMQDRSLGGLLRDRHTGSHGFRNGLAIGLAGLAALAGSASVANASSQGDLTITGTVAPGDTVNICVSDLVANGTWILYENSVTLTQPHALSSSGTGCINGYGVTGSPLYGAVGNAVYAMDQDGNKTESISLASTPSTTTTTAVPTTTAATTTTVPPITTTASSASASLPDLGIVGTPTVGNTVVIEVANLTPNGTWTLYAGSGAITQPHVLDDTGSGQISYTITSTTLLAGAISQGLQVYAMDSSGVSTPPVNLNQSAYATNQSSASNYAQDVQDANAFLASGIQYLNNNVLSPGLTLSGGTITASLTTKSGASMQTSMDVATGTTDYDTSAPLGGLNYNLVNTIPLKIGGTLDNVTTTSFALLTSYVDGTATLSNGQALDSTTTFTLGSISNDNCTLASTQTSFGSGVGIQSQPQQVTCGDGVVIVTAGAAYSLLRQVLSIAAESAAQCFQDGPCSIVIDSDILTSSGTQAMTISQGSPTTVAATYGIGTQSDPFVANANGIFTTSVSGYYDLTNAQANGGNSASIYYVNNPSFITSYNDDVLAQSGSATTTTISSSGGTTTTIDPAVTTTTAPQSTTVVTSYVSVAPLSAVNPPPNGSWTYIPIYNANGNVINYVWTANGSNPGTPLMTNTPPGISGGYEYGPNTVYAANGSVVGYPYGTGNSTPYYAEGQNMAWPTGTIGANGTATMDGITINWTTGANYIGFGVSGLAPSSEATIMITPPNPQNLLLISSSTILQQNSNSGGQLDNNVYAQGVNTTAGIETNIPNLIGSVIVVSQDSNICDVMI